MLYNNPKSVWLSTSSSNISRFTANGIHRPNSFIRTQVSVRYQISLKNKTKQNQFPFSEAFEFGTFGTYEAITSEVIEQEQE